MAAGHGATQLSVAPQRRQHQRGDRRQLRVQPDCPRKRLRRTVQRRRFQRGRQCHERGCDPHRTSGGGGPSGPIFDVHFDTTADEFVYQDDLFRATNQPGYASSTYIASGGFTGGALRVSRRRQRHNIASMSGGWQRPSTLTEAGRSPLRSGIASPKPRNAADEFGQHPDHPRRGPLWRRAQRLHRPGRRQRPGEHRLAARADQSRNGRGRHATSWRSAATTIRRHTPDETVEILVDDVLLEGPAAPTPPSITTPPANLTVTAPTSASFSVVAAGTAPLSYQWRRNGANISGATGTSYVLNPTAGSDSGSTFDVVVTNSVGSVTSAAATLTVNNRPSVTTPPANVTGSPRRRLTATLLGRGTTERRRSVISGGLQWQPTSAAQRGTSSVQSIRPTGEAMTARHFDVVSSPRTSRAASQPGKRGGHAHGWNAPPSITTPPANVTVTAPGVRRPSRLWPRGRRRSVISGGATAPNSLGGTHASYVLNPTAGSNSGATFDVVVSNVAGSITSAAGTLTVNSDAQHHDAAGQRHRGPPGVGDLLGRGPRARRG